MSGSPRARGAAKAVVFYLEPVASCHIGQNRLAVIEQAHRQRPALLARARPAIFALAAMRGRVSRWRLPSWVVSCCQLVAPLPCYGLLLPPAPSSLACCEPAQQILRRIGAQFKIILDDRLRRGAVAVALPCFFPLARRGFGRPSRRQAPRRNPKGCDRRAAARSARQGGFCCAKTAPLSRAAQRVRPLPPGSWLWFGSLARAASSSAAFLFVSGVTKSAIRPVSRPRLPVGVGVGSTDFGASLGCWVFFGSGAFTGGVNNGGMTCGAGAVFSGLRLPRGRGGLWFARGGRRCRPRP